MHRDKYYVIKIKNGYRENLEKEDKEPELSIFDR